MAARYPMKRATLELVVEGTKERFILPIKNASNNTMTDDVDEMRFTITISPEDFLSLIADKNVDITPIGSAPKLQLMVHEHGRAPGMLGMVKLNKLEVGVISKNFYTAHATLDEWYAAIDPPKTKAPTDEDVILRAVNESPLLKIMVWRDYLTEIGADEGLIFGLNWLIERKKIPEELEYSDQELQELWDTKGWPRMGTQKTGYQWRIVSLHPDTSVPCHLPMAIRRDIETILDDDYAPRVIARQFITVADAYKAAALAIWKHRNNLEAESVGLGTGGEEEEYDDDVDYDAP